MSPIKGTFVDSQDEPDDIGQLLRRYNLDTDQASAPSTDELRSKSHVLSRSPQLSTDDFHFSSRNREDPKDPQSADDAKDFYECRLGGPKPELGNNHRLSKTHTLPQNAVNGQIEENSAEIDDHPSYERYTLKVENPVRIPDNFESIDDEVPHKNHFARTYTVPYVSPASESRVLEETPIDDNGNPQNTFVGFERNHLSAEQSVVNESQTDLTKEKGIAVLNDVASTDCFIGGEMQLLSTNDTREERDSTSSPQDNTFDNANRSASRTERNIESSEDYQTKQLVPNGNINSTASGFTEQPTEKRAEIVEELSALQLSQRDKNVLTARDQPQLPVLGPLHVPAMSAQLHKSHNSLHFQNMKYGGAGDDIGDGWTRPLHVTMTGGKDTTFGTSYTNHSGDIIWNQYVDLTAPLPSSRINVNRNDTRREEEIHHCRMRVLCTGLVIALLLVIGITSAAVLLTSSSSATQQTGQGSDDAPANYTQRLIRRAQWSTHTNQTFTDLVVIPPRLLIVEHSASSFCYTAPICENVIRSIESWHIHEDYGGVGLLVVIHSATSFCTSAPLCENTIRSMETFHLQSGFSGIGYNFMIGGDGYIYEGRGWGKEGAHSFGFNCNSIGVAFVGNFDQDELNPEMLKAFEILVEEGVREGALAPDYKLVGHYQVKTIASPGLKIKKVIKSWPHWTGTVAEEDRMCIKLRYGPPTKIGKV